ncbi:FtsX-like permease family protein [Streptomyces sp. NPDC101227]|uniref:FtsX-like permease family protein n=1 Tax=Streptomyces sp. NPDC101227 TaxID=3366136 RepID=UPI0038156F1A
MSGYDAGGRTGRCATWVRDLAIGIRFAAGGGREGWVRTALTAVGVGLGVALLLGATSVPHVLDRWKTRTEATTPVGASSTAKPTARTLLLGYAETSFRGATVGGVLLHPDGPAAPRPPGVAALPRPGEMVVSPALKELLGSAEGRLLRERLPYRTVGTIGEPGLAGPGELAYYAGSASLTAGDNAFRVTGFGQGAEGAEERPMDPRLVLLVVVACVVLLMPVAIFIATAVRFGGERRDRRLAALRLVGADVRMTHRMAAGEALFGSVCGLVVGGALFLAARPLAGRVTLWGVNAFPGDVTPVRGPALLVLVTVPVLSVAVTLVALRRVTIEPLGVVRDFAGRRRRLWWRLPLPAAGAALMLLSGGQRADGAVLHTDRIAGGAVLFLVGITVLLPWLVEAVVGRFKGGPVAWQLATRRLQLSSGAAARAVSGITVAVAGAIALQVFFAAVQSDFMKVTGQDSGRAQLDVELPAGDAAATGKMIARFRATEGVRGVIAGVNGSVSARPVPGRNSEEPLPAGEVTVGDCATLRELARIGPCTEGDVFVVRDGGVVHDRYLSALAKIARPGARVLLNREPGSDAMPAKPRWWTVPESARVVPSRPDPMGTTHFGIFATARALDPAALADPHAYAMIRIDARVPDAEEYVRNTAARIDPALRVRSLQDVAPDRQFADVRTGLLIASAATLALIAASMLVTTLEQLRERRRPLSVLVAFGTRRGTLGWSVLWGAAVPVGLGLALSVAGGTGLGLVLLRMVGKSGFVWSAVWPPTAAGAALVLVVTLLSLPPLWRLMRPDGLRTE